MKLIVGCAGWNLGAESKRHFSTDGSHLARYSTRFNGVEINSTFYRSHRASTYVRWATSTPAGFRFAVKAPRKITHEKRLIDAEAELMAFLNETKNLGSKLGLYLFQFPGSFAFAKGAVDLFFRNLRKRIELPIVCEPRHHSWFEPAAEAVLKRHGVDRAAVDPSRFPQSSVPGGIRRAIYFRWHGSPRMYYSKYDERAIVDLAEQMTSFGRSADSVWCIFDNTASGAALENALELTELLAGRRVAARRR
jgi:uncharacterized protein YecE (DUF72 family)